MCSGDKCKLIGFIFKTCFQVCCYENKVPNEILAILQHGTIVFNSARAMLNENNAALP